MVTHLLRAQKEKLISNWNPERLKLEFFDNHPQTECEPHLPVVESLSLGLSRANAPDGSTPRNTGVTTIVTIKNENKKELVSR